MIKRRLKSWVIPTLYSITCVVIIGGLTIIGNTINNNLEVVPSDNVTDVMVDTEKPVIKEEEVTETKIIKPFLDETVSIDKNFYSSQDDETTQQNSLIFYENIYMQNTGVLYSADQKFNILSVLDGIVKNIKEDNILGNIIEIEHSANLTTYYQSVDEVKVNVGDTVTQGTIIATSGINNIEGTKENSFHFQVFNKGILIDPEEFYKMEPKDLQ